MSSDALRRVEAELLARRPESQVEPSLERISELIDLLGEPQRAFPVVHVGGTNGKTSTARMVDELLRELNLRTGRYTSPHLQSVTERIVIDGEPIDEELFLSTYAELSPYLDMVDARHDVQLGYFEVLTAIAYAAFADAPVDVAVVEVGMGGSWDATNVADGKVAVVTPISVDHAEYLGDTVELISEEKAGIIKPGSYAVLAAQEAPAADVLLSRVAQAGVSVARQGVEFGVRHREMAVGGQVISVQGLAGLYDDIFLPLHGEHQAHNAAVALAAVEAFVGGGRELNLERVQSAFARVASPGRLEVLRRGPVVLADAAHNPASAEALAAALSEEFASTSLVAVVAVLGDKDAAGILAALEPVVASVVVTENSSPRCLAADDLEPIAVDVFGEERVHVATPLPEAVDAALALAEREGETGGHGVVVTGSVVTSGDVREAFHEAAT
ncbi:dihydrofolate synthase/folylpolyglutamate synthase [Haloactinopolyspora alba]|uniref:Dihydrofolate synthase/folylpolyglutamate synthase n=1 Tax=Haloactinopolyspora alba TaxID=648780 RepID=A0A2P8EBB7_9ACTN|nr:Mur ligase family protein [Haloactinopolyspora alba]PSL06765.1 dihydrofolate synthase/folylpolyglutamate synthase [Haloactinopolyspora alba]